jgi:hypothetical protein
MLRFFDCAGKNEPLLYKNFSVLIDLRLNHLKRKEIECKEIEIKVKKHGLTEQVLGSAVTKVYVVSSLKENNIQEIHLSR